MPNPEGEKDRPECQYYHLKGVQHINKPANEATSQLQTTTPGPDHGPAAARCPSKQKHGIIAPTSMQCHQSQHNTPSYHTHPLLPCCNLPETPNKAEGSDLQPQVEEQQI